MAHHLQADRESRSGCRSGSISRAVPGRRAASRARRPAAPGQFAQPAVERGLRRHAALLLSMLLAQPRFKCTSSSEIAAGVMPEMRAAWPMVSGRWRLSFCCTSATVRAPSRSPDPAGKRVRLRPARRSTSSLLALDIALVLRLNFDLLGHRRTSGSTSRDYERAIAYIRPTQQSAASYSRSGRAPVALPRQRQGSPTSTSGARSRARWRRACG